MASVQVNGKAVKIRWGSLNIEKRIEERSVASFIIDDIPGTETYLRGHSVVIHDPENVRVFGGVIADPKLVRLAPSGGLSHIIKCTDYGYFADKRLVLASYTAEDAGVIVAALHANYLDAEGITIGEIQAGPEIVGIDFNYIKVSEALDKLAEYAGFTWFIDENKALYFVDRTTYAADWNWSVTTPKPKGGQPSLSRGNRSYRNVQYVRGGTGVTGSEQEENRIGDGKITSFIMSYALATEPVITEDIVNEMTVGIRGLETGFNYYWNKGDKVVTAANAPLDGVAVQIKYYGQYPLISQSFNEAERVARQAIEGGTGLVESIADEVYHESGESSLESARAKIADHARSATKFTYPTTTKGIKPGQLQTVNYPLFGLINEDMLIESVIITEEGENLWKYEVTAILGPVTGSWVRFFSTLVRGQTALLHITDAAILGLRSESESLALAESTSKWNQEKGEYCWAPKTNGGAMREARWGFFTYG